MNKLVPTKRRRTPLSCVNCRKRKVRCDRTKPRCLRCANTNVECVYTAPTLWSCISDATIEGTINKSGFFVSTLDNPTSIHPNGNDDTIILESDSIEQKLKKIKKLQEQINQIKDTFDTDMDCISLVLDYDNTSLSSFASKKNVRFVSLGSFTTPSVWRRDPLMCSFIETLFIIRKIAFESIESRTENIAERYYPKSLKVPKIPLSKRFDFLNTQVKQRKVITIINNLDEFANELEKTLPPLEIVQYHIDYFMNFIHPFIFVLDERIFRKNIHDLLHVNSFDPNKTDVELKSKLDLARISLLILVVRISYLALFLKSQPATENASDKIRQVLLYPINAEVINLVLSALNKLNYTRKSSVETLQVILLLRFYQSHACEDGDGYFGGNGTVPSGIVCSIARIIGLHKDFQNSVDSKLALDSNSNLKYQISPRIDMNLLTRGSGPYVNLWKKLWHLTLRIDLTQAMQDGSTPLLDHDPLTYPNKLNQFCKESSNVMNEEVESFIRFQVKYFLSIDFELATLLKSLNNYNEKATIYSVDQSLQKIISTIDNSKKSLQIENCSSTINDLYEVYLTKTEIDVFNSLLIIQYNLLLHSEHLASNENTREIGNNRFKAIFKSTIMRWIHVANLTLKTWRKITDVPLTSSDNLKHEYANFIIILAPTILSVYGKLMLALFYLSIRILVFTHVIEGIEFSTINIDTVRQIDEFKKMYEHLLRLMKALVLTQERMSVYWYVGLRNYAMFRRLIEWFESGGKFTLEYESRSGPKDIKATEIGRNKETKETISKLLLSTDLWSLIEINTAFSNLEVDNGLEKLNQEFSFERANLKKDVGTLGEQATIPIDMNDSHIDSNMDEFLSYDQEFMNFLQPIELGDWNAVTEWFDQSSTFDPLDMFSFNT
ncbi:hypothetical protein CANINC_001398 [Pichia inconspicua]|uniref:Zn(2)-C6 fungal-type domain-containing protein n=1 Tax=Pichia inconspicua TaxID=52247 RepID=A0A4T0X3T7_9ASCO|nr:hypothetical protein CANINC_001398 [[Candida] inconspicua]